MFREGLWEEEVEEPAGGFEGTASQHRGSEADQGLVYTEESGLRNEWGGGGRRVVLGTGKGAGQTRRGPPLLPKRRDLIGNMLATSRLQGCRQGSDKVWFTVYKPLPAVLERVWGGQAETVTSSGPHWSRRGWDLGRVRCGTTGDTFRLWDAWGGGRASVGGCGFQAFGLGICWVEAPPPTPSPPKPPNPSALRILSTGPDQEMSPCGLEGH